MMDVFCNRHEKNRKYLSDKLYTASIKSFNDYVTKIICVKCVFKNTCLVSIGVPRALHSRSVNILFEMAPLLSS